MRKEKHIVFIKIYRLIDRKILEGEELAYFQRDISET